MTAAIIPAYEPIAAFPAFVQALLAEGVDAVVVVDDGSSPAARPLFDAVAALGGVTVLRHEVNRGKGAALRTALAHAAAHLPACDVFVTADADGQHAPADCRAVADAAAQTGGLVLGVRAFAFRSTPFRSWWGNRWTAVMFALLQGRWVADTQTGLRAFRRDLLPLALAVADEGYAYEMGVLCAAARAGVPFRSVAVRTIYADGNATSHFSPLRDTLRIWRVQAREFLRRARNVFAGCRVCRKD